MKFYIYKPLVSLENFVHLKNYINQKIWLTQLCDLNDPFEGKFHGDDNFNKDIFNLFHSHGVICLTNSCENIPMWAHYAKNHTGYCIVFEIDFDFIREKYKNIGAQLDIDNIINPKSLESQEILLFRQPEDDPDKNFIFTKVMYQKNIPIINKNKFLEKENNYNQSKYISQHSFGIKFKQWEYECEYRLVVNANSKNSDLMHLKGYPFLKITGIIMGERIGKNLQNDARDLISNLELHGHKFNANNLEHKTREFVYHLCSQGKIETYNAICSHREYKIDIEKYNADIDSNISRISLAEQALA